jgi:hypothetical protein
MAEFRRLVHRERMRHISRIAMAGLNGRSRQVLFFYLFNFPACGDRGIKRTLSKRLLGGQILTPGWEDCQSGMQRYFGVCQGMLISSEKPI